MKKIFEVFDRSEKRKLVLVIFATFAMGLAQMAGVGVVLPFISLLANPEQIQDHAVYSWLFGVLGFESRELFVVLFGVLLLLVFVLSNVFTAFTLWYITRFTWSFQKDISSRLLAGYLARPYEDFLNQNSAETGKNILTESQQFTSGVLMQSLILIAYSVTIFFIICFLIWVSPTAALTLSALFVTAYLLVYATIRHRVLDLGKMRLQANTQRFKAVDEAFGSIKEVKVLGREGEFQQNYDPPARTFADSQASAQLISQIPKFIIETLAFSLIMVTMMTLAYTNADMVSALPAAGTFVVAGYRLLPALQTVYGTFTRLRYNTYLIEMFHADLMKYARPVGNSGKHEQDRDRLEFRREITLERVHYAYPHSSGYSLKDINIKIPRNSFVAFTGPTGAGKTTLVDIILGLLPPNEGRFLIDGHDVDASNRRSWQNNLGYVPQDIYLIDDTVTRNIAYGVADSDISLEAVERAARIANIHDFIEAKLPQGYQTEVGERGVRLSGGQRQRIGIARALYHDPHVIVLDEATSALDNETEKRIVDELDAMRGGRTLIVIAHRLSTVSRCNHIFLLADGEIRAEGSYEDLIRESPEFARLAQKNG